MNSSLADPVERTVRIWPHIIMAKNDKKHLKNCNYDSVAKFGMEGVGIRTIILFFSDEN